MVHAISDEIGCENMPNLAVVTIKTGKIKPLTSEQQIDSITIFVNLRLSLVSN